MNRKKYIKNYKEKEQVITLNEDSKSQKGLMFKF